MLFSSALGVLSCAVQNMEKSTKHRDTGDVQFFILGSFGAKIIIIDERQPFSDKIQFEAEIAL
ncbi:hypothetical protein [Maribacter aestuarii]|uniref:hypothetical protein n=1 Tax=Maribacter aestuarii TaxID=1130723 RepID=UPI00248C3087|nr:hypothetical protein [Maribacter aestuarii]